MADHLRTGRGPLDDGLYGTTGAFPRFGRYTLWLATALAVLRPAARPFVDAALLGTPVAAPALGVAVAAAFALAVAAGAADAGLVGALAAGLAPAAGYGVAALVTALVGAADGTTLPFLGALAGAGALVGVLGYGAGRAARAV